MKGFGVLTTTDVAGEIWVHFSAVDTTGFRSLVQGQRVMFEVEDLGAPVQDGYRYRATRVVPLK